jgi:CheY-like chemotaxis protein
MAHAPILIVEDHDDTREALAAVLLAHGYAVETAENGRDALTKLRAGLRPCLILTDLSMPVMNGFEFRHHQLADPSIASIPLIALSAVVEQKDTEALLANAYLSKPTEIADLIAAVARFCRAHRAAA